MNPLFFTSVINGYFAEPHASLLSGILFGIPLNTKTVFYDELRRVGLLHLVVLSGINITLLAALTATLTSRIPKKFSLLLTILVVILFVLFVGAKPPIVRAGIMGILSAGAILYGRPYLALYGLLFSAVCIGIVSPEWLGTVSFQLSFGATAGIILFGARGSSFGDGYVKRELRTSLAAQVFTTPLIFWYFKQISLISLLANVLVAGLILPLMIFGFLIVILGSINFLMGLIPSYVAYILLTWIIWVVHILSLIPYSFFDFSH